LSTVGLLKSLLTTFVTPVLVPLADGLKVVEMVHEAPGSNAEEQLLFEEKSPVAAIDPSTKLWVPEGFLMVIVFGALVVPTAWPANVSLLGESEMACPAP
jgi:hypothetical protein